MNLTDTLHCAVDACRDAGGLMRANHQSTKKINEATRHDIKLELDVRCQKRIEKRLRKAYPDIAILGEEGVIGDTEADHRWVVDPIDGTVNFAYGIPHCCTTIALQRRARDGTYETQVGVIYDPFCDELWTAIRGRAARLNNRVIRVSKRPRLGESLIGVGFAKEKSTMQRMLPVWNQLIPRVRKIRMMGAAALGLAYVASGRLEGYLEYGLRIWDVAAGGLMIECAGGCFWSQPLPERYRYHIIGSNNLLKGPLAKFR